MGRKKYISLNQTKDIVVYREAKYSDIPELCGIVSEAFDFGSFLDNEKDLYSMTKCFLGQYFFFLSGCCFKRENCWGYFWSCQNSKLASSALWRKD